MGEYLEAPSMSTCFSRYAELLSGVAVPIPTWAKPAAISSQDRDTTNRDLFIESYLM